MKGHGVPPPPVVARDCFTYDPEYTRELFDIPWSAWHDDYEMMVVAPMRLAKAAPPHLRASGRGSFVVISGIEAEQPRMSFPADRPAWLCTASSSSSPTDKARKVFGSMLSLRV